MRIIDPFYIITTQVILIGTCILMYTKLYLVPASPYHITIYGSSIDTILFAYELSKALPAHLNITLITRVDPEIMHYLDSRALNSKGGLASLYSPYIDRKIIRLCGNQPRFMELLEDTHLQYKLKRSQIVFHRQKNGKVKGLKSTKNFIDEFSSDIYSVSDEDNTLSSMLTFGLSHLTAKFIFAEFQEHVASGISYKDEYRTLGEILQMIMPMSQKLQENGFTYMSETIGLDQTYISDYVNPILSNAQFHNVNPITMFSKLMPLYCSNEKRNDHAKHLALLLDEKVLAAKLLMRMRDNPNFQLTNSTVTSFSEGEQGKVRVTTGLSDLIETDLLFILGDTLEDNRKEVTFHKVIVDGLLPTEDQFEEFYTIYFQQSPILSVTRLCAINCKDFKNSVYLVVSKVKLSEKDLTMFTVHQIVTAKKTQILRSQLPSQASNLRQAEHIYRLPPADVISDNYEIKLIIFRGLAKMASKKMHSKNK